MAAPEHERLSRAADESWSRLVVVWLDGSVLVEEKLVQLDDGEVEWIFDDEVVEAVCDSDPVA